MMERERVGCSLWMRRLWRSTFEDETVDVVAKTVETAVKEDMVWPSAIPELQLII
jgi:hypothetical protein